MTPKGFVSIIAGVLVFCDATVSALYISEIGFAKITSQGIRFFLTCLLAYSLIKGWNPGRWITIVLLGLGAILSILNVFGSMTQPVVLALFLVYVVCIAGLLTPDARRHFNRKTNSDVKNKFDVSQDLKCNYCDLVVNEKNLDSDLLVCPECRGLLI